MTPKQLATLLKRRLAEKGLMTNALHTKLIGKCSHMTVYNAVRGKPIKTETLLLIMDALDLEIVTKERKR